MTERLCARCKKDGYCEPLAEGKKLVANTLDQLSPGASEEEKAIALASILMPLQTQHNLAVKNKCPVVGDANLSVFVNMAQGIEPSKEDKGQKPKARPK